MSIEPAALHTPLPSVSIDDVTRYRIVPVVTIDDPDDAEPLGDALVAAGLPVVEITLRTPAAADALAAVAGRTDLVAGAGSVRSVADLERVLDLGARFVVSPGLHVDVVSRCLDRGVPHLPGAATASDLMAASALGISTVKLFPASVLGGRRALDALAAPFPDLRFVPTGGITSRDAHEYLAHPQVTAVGGTWIAPRTAIAEGNWAAITAAATAAVDAAAAQ